jgi:hypothetical protein
VPILLGLQTYDDTGLLEETAGGLWDHFTDEDTEAQGWVVTCLKPHRAGQCQHGALNLGRAYFFLTFGSQSNLA